MKIAIIGYGNIGSGVASLLRENGMSIAARLGERLELKKVLDIRNYPGDPIMQVLTHEFSDISEDPEIETVIETIGGTGVAYTYVKTLLLAGKNVCTSNKALVAKYGAELIEVAKQKNKNFFFEASVGGGIPIIRPLMQCLTADRISKIEGIVNGTTNYILTKMADEGMDFEPALNEAMEKGYAEPNPAADIDGVDAGRKLVILASLICGKNVNYDDIEITGITEITQEDIKAAAAAGEALKLTARAEFEWENSDSENISCRVKASVAPRRISKDSALYTVNGVTNAVLVTGNMLGDVVFTGAGAGKGPTASAIISDVIETVRNRGKNIPIIWSREMQKLER